MKIRFKEAASGIDERDIRRDRTPLRPRIAEYAFPQGMTGSKTPACCSILTGDLLIEIVYLVSSIQTIDYYRLEEEVSLQE